ncbi:MAG: FHA domain-containing protein [Desulfarculaceae bacterium]|nr:FHA domain-containing protein [Desulfarculaceae bacterium]MCF8072135.1 FHA domain-containing protein [Desulfarculaceae bacterium]MCF8100056.1 FHA domain-containing protein [Desulfarculaceae bacterium]MCF8118263.1 FHA domain-containing protein [Desulfarculaceae bacterium]
MGTGRGILKLGAAFALLLCLALTSWAAPVKFSLPQVSVYLPRITIFASLINEAGKPITTVSQAQLSAKLDGDPLKISSVAPFEKSGRGVAYTLALDVSKTMAGAPFSRAMEDIKKLINGLGPKDRLAVIAFGDLVSVVSDFSGNKNELLAKVEQIKPTSLKTLYFSGVKSALELNQRYDDDLPSYRAIIVVSDGKDEGSGITLEDLLDLNRRAGIPIYCLGYTRIEPQYLDGLKRLSDLNGGFFMKDPAARENGGLFRKIKQAIDQQLVVSCQDAQGRADGSDHVLQLVYSQGQINVAAEKHIYFDRAEPLPEPPAGLAAKIKHYSRQVLVFLHLPTGKYWQWGLFAAACLFLAIVLVLCLWLLLGRKGKELPAEGDQGQDAHGHSTTDAITKQDTRSGETIPSGQGGNLSTPTVEPEPEEQPVLEFVALTGPQKGSSFKHRIPPGGLTIGRRGTQWDIPDDEVSKRHCQISWTGHRFLITDTDSSNGTILNGVPVRTPEALDNGSTIEIGKSKYRVNLVAMP